MKSLKSIIFFIAVITAALLAISQTAKPSSAKSYPSTLYVQFDCVSGSEVTPVILRNIEGRIVVLNQAEAYSICPQEGLVICAAEYEVTMPGSIEKPLKVINGKMQFNPDYPGGEVAAQNFQILGIILCPGSAD